MLVPHIINGTEVPEDTRTGAVFNPATGAEIRRVSFASTATLERALDAAEAALPGWRATGLQKRA